MSHEIEAEFVADWGNVANQCQNCTSFMVEDGQGYCSESKSTVPLNGHCNFFQSLD